MATSIPFGGLTGPAYTPASQESTSGKAADDKPELPFGKLTGIANPIKQNYITSSFDIATEALPIIVEDTYEPPVEDYTYLGEVEDYDNGNCYDLEHCFEKEVSDQEQQGRMEDYAALFFAQQSNAGYNDIEIEPQPQDWGWSY